MNQLNELHSDIPKEPPRKWNNQPSADHFKSSSSPSRTNPVVSAIMGKLNHCAINNGDITSDIPVESIYDSVTDPDTTPIKSIYDYEMDHLLEFFHSEHDDDFLYVDLQMLQA